MGVDLSDPVDASPETGAAELVIKDRAAGLDLLRGYSAGSVSGTALEAAIATSAASAKAAVDAFKDLHGEYQASGASRHARFEDTADRVTTALVSMAHREDLAPEDRMRVAIMIREALDASRQVTVMEAERSKVAFGYAVSALKWTAIVGMVVVLLPLILMAGLIIGPVVIMKTWKKAA